MTLYKEVLTYLPFNQLSSFIYSLSIVLSYRIQVLIGNILCFRVQSINKKIGKSSETLIKPNSTTFSQIVPRFPKRTGTSIPVKKKPSRKKSQIKSNQLIIAPKAKPSYVKDFLDSGTYVCICDECSTTSFTTREINSLTYTKYSPECLLNMEYQESTTIDPAPRQPPGISNTLCSAVDGPDSRSDSSYKTDHRVHTFQKFNRGPHNHLSPWQSTNLSQVVVLSHTQTHKDGNAVKLKHKNEDRENPLQTVQHSVKKEVDGHSSHTKTLTWGSLRPPHPTSALGKTTAEDPHCHGQTVVENKPSVDDYINTYTIMSPRMNEKATNTKENFHHLVKERFCLPNNMYESSSSPAFYTECSKCCRE